MSVFAFVRHNPVQGCRYARYRQHYPPRAVMRQNSLGPAEQSLWPAHHDGGFRPDAGDWINRFDPASAGQASLGARRGKTGTRRAPSDYRREHGYPRCVVTTGPKVRSGRLLARVRSACQISSGKLSCGHRTARRGRLQPDCSGRDQIQLGRYGRANQRRADGPGGLSRPGNPVADR